MAKYSDPVLYSAHDFGTTAVTIDKQTPVGGTGLHMVEVEFDDDQIELLKADDGNAVASFSQSTSGKMKMQILEASQTTDYLYNLYEERRSFSVSVLDSNAPNFDCSGRQCYFTKKPVVKRVKNADFIEWSFTVTYMVGRGGSYRIESTG